MDKITEHDLKSESLMCFNKLEILYQKKDSVDNWNKEKDDLEHLIPLLLDKICNDFKMIDPIDLGGAGIIWKVEDLRSPDRNKVYRALKMPRPIQGIHTTIENEAKALLTVRHPNIIPVHFVNQVILKGLTYSFFVMDFVENGEDLNKTTKRILEEIQKLRTQWHTEQDVESRKKIDKLIREKTNSSIKWLTLAIKNISSAVSYLHSNGIIHFDIKPANILVASDGSALLADLGYAKNKNITEAKEITIGFTEFYAHPELASERFKSTGDKKGNRCKKIINPREFQEKWDVFALGKSILHLLSMFEERDRTLVSVSPLLNFLHLAACRMLDGRNRMVEESRRDRSDYTYFEEWRGLKAEDFGREGLKYTSSKEIAEDMTKITGDFRLEDLLPELSDTNRDRIQTDYDYPAVFTNRVKAIINHPAYNRLKLVPQLGLISYVYPTATHTRFEHSLGVYAFVCEYVKALWYDTENPLFKQWMTIKDIRSIIVASFLHDIGHFPLGHDLEDSPPENYKEMFDHIKLGVNFINSDIVDTNGKTLRDILTDVLDGWNVDPEFVIDILNATKVITTDIFDSAITPKAKFLANILSGSLDADKLDYLIRDSQSCKLRYGQVIDIKRLFRTLTTSIQNSPDPDHPDDATKQRRTIEISIYEKGKSAAESIGFARYLMYQAVYSHHAARSIRAMLEMASTQIFTNTDKDKTTEKMFYKMIGLEKVDDLYNNIEIDVDDIYDFLEKRGNDITKLMVSYLRKRKIYRRIITVHRIMSTESRSGQELYSRIQRSQKRFLPKLRKELIESFERNRSKSLISINAPSDIETSNLYEILNKDYSLLVDIPKTKYGSPMDLCIIPELEGLKRNDDAKMNASQIMGDVWRNVYGKLIDSISKIRIYCHPDIRDTLTSVLGYEELNKALVKSLE